MNKFIYRGIYYPVIGCQHACFESYNNKGVIEKKLGGYTGFWSFLPTVGVKCRLGDPKKPYKQSVIDKVKKHPEMIIKKEYFESGDDKLSFMYSVHHKKSKKYIGDIRSAYFLTGFVYLKSKYEVINVGYHKKTKSWCGWSHRGMQCFKEGDKMFESKFGDDNTPFNQHGSIDITKPEQALESAYRFAEYVS